MTQDQASEAISHYTDTTWTQATVATAETSVTGTRIRQFTPSELLAFCFAFDVPIGWFFMPPTGAEADALAMAGHDDGIGWDWVFRSTTPSESNIDAYLDHQRDWIRRLEQESERRPFHDRHRNVGRTGHVLGVHELQEQFLLGLVRHELAGTANPSASWFQNASVVLAHVSRIFDQIAGSETTRRAAEA